MDNASPRISVIMPTFNQDRFIDKAVTSILDGWFKDFELIIINDGSTDGTADYLASLSDPRVRLFHQENRGFPKTVNRGLGLARGEFVTWASSDNIYLPWFLEAHNAALMAHPECGYSYSAFYLIDENDTVTQLFSNNHLALRNLVISDNGGGCCTFLYPRKHHELAGPYDETMRYACDTDFWERLFRHFDPIYVVEPTCLFREHAEAASTAKKDIIGQDMGSAILRNLQEIATGQRSLPSVYGLKNCDEADWFNISCNFGAKVALRTRNLRMATPFYQQALSLTPKRQILALLSAFIEVSVHLTPVELLATVAAALEKNPNISADQSEILLSLVPDMRAVVDESLDDASMLHVMPDCPELDSQLRLSRKSYSYFAARTLTEPLRYTAPNPP